MLSGHVVGNPVESTHNNLGHVRIWTARLPPAVSVRYTDLVDCLTARNGIWGALVDIYWGSSRFRLIFMPSGMLPLRSRVDDVLGMRNQSRGGVPSGVHGAPEAMRQACASPPANE